MKDEPVLSIELEEWSANTNDGSINLNDNNDGSIDSTGEEILLSIQRQNKSQHKIVYINIWMKKIN